MDKAKAAADIVAQVLPLAPFEGWTQSALGKAALAAGYRKTDVIRVFPGGAMDAIDFFQAQYDQKLIEELSRYHLDTMKIRQRIATAVRLRIGLHEPHREALRRAVALQAIPFNSMHALKNLYATVDTIWHGIGDTSTDFNFYSKRIILAGVYSSTLLFWLDDTSAGYENSWTFLDRRIEDVMRIEKAKYGIRAWFEKIDPLKRAG